MAGGFLRKLGSGLGTLFKIDQALFLFGDTGAEKRLGYLLARFFLATNKINRDPELNAYVNGIFERLKAASPRSKYRYRIHIINSPTINAFALPGGTIFIYRGMIDFARSDDELACVLGHEIAHAYRRHGMKRMRRNAAAQILIAKLFENQQDAQLLAQVGNLFVSQSFSRRNEDESDSVGMQIAAGAGYDPAGATTLWERMDARYGSRRGLQGWLSSHPSHQARVKNTRKWLEDHGHEYRQTQGKSYDSKQNRLVDLVLNGSFEWADKDGGPAHWEVTEGDPAALRYPTETPLGGRASVAGAPARGASLQLSSAPIRASTFRSPRVLSARARALEGSPIVYLGLQFLDGSGKQLDLRWPGGHSIRLSRGEERLLRSPPIDPQQFPPGTKQLRVVMYLGRLFGGVAQVDDVRLLPGERLDEAISNLLPGGDLEQDGDGDGVPDGYVVEGGGREDLDFAEGFASVRLDGSGTARLWTPRVPVRMGQTYAFGALVRSDTRGLRGRIVWAGFDPGGNPVPGGPPPARFTFTPDWKPARDSLTLQEVPGFPRLGSIRLGIEVTLRPGQQAFVDDLRLELVDAPEGAVTGPAPALDPPPPPRPHERGPEMPLEPEDPDDEEEPTVVDMSERRPGGASETAPEPEPEPEEEVAPARPAPPPPPRRAPR
jgi:Zn-dependent protease with chaperone function